jgi:hypothetical protein
MTSRLTSPTVTTSALPVGVPLCLRIISDYTGKGAALQEDLCHGDQLLIACVKAWDAVEWPTGTPDSGEYRLSIIERRIGRANWTVRTGVAGVMRS